MKKIPIYNIKGGMNNMESIKVSDTSSDYILNYMKNHTQENHAESPIDVDTVELSGLSQTALDTIQSGLKPVYIDDNNVEDLFDLVDIALKELKKQTEEYTKYLEKYREKQRIKKRIQQQKALQKAALMKDTGLLWTSELSPEAKQDVMSKSPKAISEYKLKKKLNKKAIEKQHDET